MLGLFFWAIKIRKCRATVGKQRYEYIVNLEKLKETAPDLAPAEHAWLT